jgi:hypothetical protein
MLKPGIKGRFPRSLFLLLLLGAMTAGLDGCAGYGYSVGASYGYPYRYQYPYSPYGNGIKLSNEALDIALKPEFARMSELGTFHPSPGTLACGIGLKQVVQFRPYRF